MAKAIKGITVEIGGNTTGLEKALQGVNRESRSVQNELKDVTRLLKLDPTNVTLLEQQQKLLASSVDATAEKLRTLKEVEEQVEKQFKSGKISGEAYRDFQRELERTKIKLNSLQTDATKDIKVKIGGETSGLDKALKSTNIESEELKKELKEVDRLLKLDPTNVTLLEQQQKLLASSVDATAEKLRTLKEVEEQVEKQFKSGKISGEAYRDFQRELERTKIKLNSLQTDATKDIKVKIGGETSGLDKALKSTNIESEELKKELKEVDRLLKLDPKNVTLLSQKQKLLTQDVTATSEKLKTLKSVQTQIKDQYKRGEIDGGQFRAFQRELEGTKKKLSGLKDEKKSVSTISRAFEETKQQAEKLHGKLQPLASGLKKVGAASASITSKGLQSTATLVSKATKAFVGFSAAAGAATVAMGTAAFEASSEFEATEAKYNTVFKGYTKQADKIVNKFQELTPASEAAARSMVSGLQDVLVPMGFARSKATELTGETMNLIGALTNFNSATQTSDTVQQKFTAALTGEYEGLKALGIQVNDTIVKQKAVEMGLASSTKEVTKQAQAQALLQLATEQSKDALAAYNAESLDTKTQMGLIKSQLTDTAAEIGKGLLPVANDMLTKFRAFTKNILPNVTGMFKGLISVISGGKDGVKQFSEGFKGFTEKIVNSFVSSLPNIATTIKNMLPAMIESFTFLVTNLVTTFPQLLPILATGAVTLFMGIIDGLNTVIPQISAMLPLLISQLGNILIQNLPQIVQGGVQLLTSLIQGISHALPMLTQKITEIIPEFVETLTAPEGLESLIDSAVDLLVALADGITKALPEIAKAIPQIIDKIVTTLFKDENIEKIIDAGVELVVALVSNVPGIIMGLAKAVPKIISGLIKAFLKLGSKLGEIGKNLLGGIWEGIANGAKWFWDKITGWCGDVVSGIMEFFGIHSPSRLMRDSVGKFLALGIGEGFVGQMDKVSKSMTKAIPNSFDVNPVIAAKSSYQHGRYTNAEMTAARQSAAVSLHIDTFNNYSNSDLSKITQVINDGLMTNYRRAAYAYGT